MAKVPNKTMGFPLKKHQLTNLDKVINDKPSLLTELLVTDNIRFKLFFFRSLKLEGKNIIMGIIHRLPNRSVDVFVATLKKS